jgi:hypothetical protein
MWVPANESNTAVAAVVDFASILPSRRRGVTSTMRLVARSSTTGGDPHHPHHHHNPKADPGAAAAAAATGPARLQTYRVDGQAWLLTHSGFDACEYIGYPTISFIGLESVRLEKVLRLVAEEAAEMEREEREAAAAARREREMEEAVEAYEAWERERHSHRVVVREVERVAVVVRMSNGLEEARANYQARMATREAACAAVVSMRGRVGEATGEVQGRLREMREAEEREEEEARERERNRVILREVQAIAEMVRLENEEEERQKEKEEEERQKEKEEEERRQCEAQAAAVSPMNQEMDTPDQECQAQGQEGRKRKRDVAEDVAHPSEPPQKKREEDRERTEADVQALVGLARATMAVVDRHQSCSGEQ